MSILGDTCEHFKIHCFPFVDGFVIVQLQQPG